MSIQESTIASSTQLVSGRGMMETGDNIPELTYSIRAGFNKPWAPTDTA
jgi:hypothetical protein